MGHAYHSSDEHDPVLLKGLKDVKKPQPIKKKVKWLDRAIQTYNYHANQVASKPSWTIVDTAELLERSLGSVSQDITIASWALTHVETLKKFKCAYEALEFIRDKKHEIKMRAIDL